MEKNNNITDNSVKLDLGKMTESMKLIYKSLKIIEDELGLLNKYQLKKIKLDTSDVNEKAERINTLAIALQKCLDKNNGGDIARQLDHLYNHIRYCVLRIKEQNDFSGIDGAEKVVKTVNSGWKELLDKHEQVVAA